jgi:hypothetical protein
MKPRPRVMPWLALAALGSALAACGKARDPREVCERARAFGLSAYLGSSVGAERIEAGAALDCAAESDVYRGAVSALERVPVPLLPPKLLLHVEPSFPDGGTRLSDLEVHRASGELLVTRAYARTPAYDADSVWLHEVGHVLSLGARPRGELGRRLLSAVEEGFADYFASASAGSPRVGAEGREVRDLTAPPRIGASEWASLALAGAFDAHRFGWQFAAELHRAEPLAGPLLEDVLRALASTEAWPTSAETPREAMRELVRRCPARSRERLDGAISRWLPRELRQG